MLNLVLATAAPVAADDTVGLVDITTGVWYLGDATQIFYGNPGDLPIAGDWDGDGDLGIYRALEQRFYLFTITHRLSPGRLHSLDGTLVFTN